MIFIDSYFFYDIWALPGQLNLFILQWEEVPSSRFDLTVLDSSDRKGTRTYIVATKDKKDGIYIYRHR